MGKLRNIILMTGMFFALFAGTVFGQEQYKGAVPVKYIPSFAGSAEVSRFASYSSIVTADFRSSFSQAHSYDVFLEKISSGIGVKLDYQTVPHNIGVTRKRYHTELIAAPKISLKGKYTISPGISFTFRHFDYIPGLLFIAVPEPVSNLSYKASLLFNSKRFYIGYALELDPFNNSINTNYYRRFDPGHSLQVGYSYQKSEESKFAFTPQLLIRTFKVGLEPGVRSIFTNLNLNFRYKGILAGIGNRQIMLGGQVNVSG